MKTIFFDFFNQCLEVDEEDIKPHLVLHKAETLKEAMSIIDDNASHKNPWFYIQVPDHIYREWLKL